MTSPLRPSNIGDFRHCVAFVWQRHRTWRRSLRATAKTGLAKFPHPASRRSRPARVFPGSGRLRRAKTISDGEPRPAGFAWCGRLCSGDEWIFSRAQQPDLRDSWLANRLGRVGLEVILALFGARSALETSCVTVPATPAALTIATDDCSPCAAFGNVGPRMNAPCWRAPPPPPPPRIHLGSRSGLEVAQALSAGASGWNAVPHCALVERSSWRPPCVAPGTEPLTLRYTGICSPSISTLPRSRIRWPARVRRGASCSGTVKTGPRVSATSLARQQTAMSGLRISSRRADVLLWPYALQRYRRLRPAQTY